MCQFYHKKILGIFRQKINEINPVIEKMIAEIHKLIGPLKYCAYNYFSRRKDYPWCSVTKCQFLRWEHWGLASAVIFASAMLYWQMLFMVVVWSLDNQIAADSDDDDDNDEMEEEEDSDDDEWRCDKLL